MKFLLKLVVKKAVVNEVPYKKNTKTAPDFIIKGDRDFEVERGRLVSFIKRCQEDGTPFYQGKNSFSFGELSITEWSNMFYKHLDHHLTQFGV